jgi:hypothetical protein
MSIAKKKRSEPGKKTSLYISKDLHARIRKIAYQRETSVSGLAVAALVSYLHLDKQSDSPSTEA